MSSLPPQSAAFAATEPPLKTMQDRRNTRQLSDWQYYRFLAQGVELPTVSPNQLQMILQAGGEFLPLLAPNLSTAPPLISMGYAGRDVFATFRNEYNATKNLPKPTRLKKLSIAMGDITLFHLLSTFLIPITLTKRLQPIIERQIPERLKQDKRAIFPKILTVSLLTIVGVLTAKPVNALVNTLLDVTYRPLVEKKKREKLIEDRNKWIQEYNQLKMQLPVNYPRVFASRVLGYSSSAQ